MDGDSKSFPGGLRSSPLFRRASEDLVALFGRAVSRISLARSETLFEQGDSGDCLYVLESGLLEVSVVSHEGRRLALNWVRSGEVVGEIALFDPGPRTASIHAVEASCLGRVRRSDLFRHIETRPDLAFEMIRLAGARLRWISQQLEHQVFLSVENRLANRLLYLATTDQTGETGVRMSQSDLADHIGATREIVSKTLAEWARNGWVEVRRGNVVILDPDAVRKNAGSEFF